MAVRLFVVLAGVSADRRNYLMDVGVLPWMRVVAAGNTRLLAWWTLGSTLGCRARSLRHLHSFVVSASRKYLPMSDQRTDGRKDNVPEALSKEPSQGALYSPRGIPLVWGGGYPKYGAVLTVECYCKWYELFLVCQNTIVGIDFGVLSQHSKNESPFCDHAPNPRAVYRFAQARGYCLDNEAFEMIIGRWEIEYRDNYDVEQEDVVNYGK